jgi:hypothetical protein
MCDDVMAQEALFLRPHEKLQLPFALQIFKSADLVEDANEQTLQALQAAGYDSIKHITVRMINRASGQMVCLAAVYNCIYSFWIMKCLFGL